MKYKLNGIFNSIQIMVICTELLYTLYFKQDFLDITYGTNDYFLSTQKYTRY